MTVTVDGDTGPFLLLLPNTNLTWPALSKQTIIWDVAGTDNAPVNASTVDILLSTDGGFTYPTTLVSNSPNDGTEKILVPDNQTTSARIMVKASENIFFDISNKDFTIGPEIDGFTMNITPSEVNTCAPNDAVYDITIESTGSFSGNVSLSSSNVPNGSITSFSNPVITAPGTSQFLVSNTNGISLGDYNIGITATGITGNETTEIEFKLFNNNPQTINLIAPVDGFINESINASLSWNADPQASTYQVQIALDQSFNTIVEEESALTNTFYESNNLGSSATYFWRVRATNGCGDGAFSSVRSFTTENETCENYISTNDNVVSFYGISRISSILDIKEKGNLEDLNINVNMFHERVSDMIMSLEHNGTTVILVDRPGIPATSTGCTSQDLDATFDDEATIPVEGICNSNPAIGGSVIPEQSLTAFDGMDIQGNWTLIIEDAVPINGGAWLQDWSFDLCFSRSAVPCPPTLTVSDNPIPNPLYEAGVSIISNGTVVTGNDVKFDAGNFIELNEGFTVQDNVTFEAVTEGGCN